MRVVRGLMSFLNGVATIEFASPQAAKREANEEVGLPITSKVIELDSMSTVPADVFRDWKNWPEGIYVVKEFAFGIEVGSQRLSKS